MTPSKAFRLTIGTLLASDTTYLNQAANANEIHLFANNFVPTENNVVADFTEPTFAGYVKATLALGAASTGNDPVTGQQVIDVAPPTTGIKFQATADTTPPQTIYGAYLTTKAAAALIAFVRFPIPVTIQYNGDQIILTNDLFRIALAPIS